MTVMRGGVMRSAAAARPPVTQRSIAAVPDGVAAKAPGREAPRATMEAGQPRRRGPATWLGRLLRAATDSEE